MAVIYVIYDENKFTDCPPFKQTSNYTVLFCTILLPV